MTDKELMQRAWEFFSHYILVNEKAQERLDEEAETILKALRTRAAQPEREWQNLTDDEYTELWGKKPALLNFFRKIESKLKQKNT